MANETLQKQIVETARRMFDAEGTRAVTMDDIAQQLHISKRTLYEQFANKGVLIEQCLEALRCEVSEQMKSIVLKADKPMLMAFLIIQQASNSRGCHNRMLHEVQTTYPEVYDHFVDSSVERVREYLTLFFQECEREGYLREGLQIADMVDIILFYLKHRTQYADGSIDRKRINEANFTFIRGMLSLKGISEYEADEKKMRAQLKQALNNNKI